MPLTLKFTDEGLARLVNAQNDGVDALVIAEVGISTEHYAGAIAALTELPDELKRVDTISGGVVDPKTIHLTVQDQTADVYSWRAFGLYSDDGVLIAAYSQADPIAEKTAGSMTALAIDIALTDAIDPESIDFGDATFSLPPATTMTQGVIRLATVAETKARALEDAAVTPKGLGETLTPIETALKRAGWRTLFLALSR